MATTPAAHWSIKTQYTEDINRLSFIADGETVMKTAPHDETCPFRNGKMPKRQRELPQTQK